MQKMMELLVDGELDGERQRELLERLDKEPDGWKRCALAFLESQNFEAELRDFAPGGDCGRETAHRYVKPGRKIQKIRQWAALLSVAAGLVVAFWVGRAWPLGSLGEGPGRLRADPPDSITFQLPAGEEGKTEEIQVPLVDGSRSDPVWQWLQDSMLAEELFSRLAEKGHQVLERRRLIPFQLEDGRQAMLPIDEIEIHPVSFPTFH